MLTPPVPRQRTDCPAVRFPLVNNDCHGGDGGAGQAGGLLERQVLRDRQQRPLREDDAFGEHPVDPAAVGAVASPPRPAPRRSSRGRSNSPRGHRRRSPSRSRPPPRRRRRRRRAARPGGWRSAGSRRRRRSCRGKFRLAARIETSTSSGPGCGSGRSTRSIAAGPPSEVTR